MLKWRQYLKWKFSPWIGSGVTLDPGSSQRMTKEVVHRRVIACSWTRGPILSCLMWRRETKKDLERLQKVTSQRPAYYYNCFHPGTSFYDCLLRLETWETHFCSSSCLRDRRLAPSSSWKRSHLLDLSKSFKP